MTPVIVIVCITCVLLVCVVLIKPSVQIKSHSFGIYWLVPLVGAFLLLIIGSVSADDIFRELTADTAINPLKILVLFLSMTVMSVFLDEIGFFKYLAGAVLRRAKSSQLVLFILLYATVSVLTVFTSNDIIILTFTPFICYFAKNAEINPVPYLFAEFVAANTWSMALIIGNPTNVYLATSNGIDFIHYASVMILPSLCAGVVAFLLLFLLFHKQLSKKITIGSETAKIEDKPALIIGLVHLGVCTALLTVSSYIGLQMWLITFVFALSLFVCAFILNIVRKGRKIPILCILGKMPYELIPFVLSMFVIVVAMENNGITSYITKLLGSSQTVWEYGATSFLTANLINNIPMSVLFSAISSGVPTELVNSAVYSTVIGSNICAFFTPVGALAGIMWSGILKKRGVKFSFLTYVKYGAAISIPTLIAALAVLKLEL